MKIRSIIGAACGFVAAVVATALALAQRPTKDTPAPTSAVLSLAAGQVDALERVLRRAVSNVTAAALAD